MARVKYASIVSSVAGSVGSATFQKSLYGDTLRNKPRPRRSASALQLTRRTIMMQLHAAWQNLTDAQRKQWNQFISYSSATIRRDRGVLLTGHALFLQYNYMRVLASYSIMTNIAYYPIKGIFDSVQLGLSGGNLLTLTVEQEYPHTETFFICKLSAPKRASLAYSPAGLVYIPIAGQSEVDFNITNIYLGIFGKLPAIGDSIHYSCRLFSTKSPIVAGDYTGVLTVHDDDI